MKLLFTTLLFASFTAHATPLMNVKDRLRIHLWFNGLEEAKPVKKKVKTGQLPEEIERVLRKI